MKNHSTLQFYIYLRKSSEGEDRQVQSIERQADEVSKLVIQQGVTVVETFQESRSAMSPNNRPEFTKMIKGIKAGKANGIICWHINRLARNPLESGIVQQLLEDEKIKRIITKDRDYTSADNAIIFSVESSLATQYSKDLGKMVKSGMEKKANMGILPSKAPLGYLNTKMTEHGSNYIIKDPERFLIIRKMWDMLLSGNYTASQVLSFANNEVCLKPTIPTNRKLGKSWLYHMFNNPFYSGLFLYKEKLYQGKHEPMVSLDEFETVQKMLGRAERSKKQKIAFSYTGMITCDECGSAITATEKIKLIKSKNIYASYVYYYCTRRKKEGICYSRQILTLQELEEQICEVLNGISISEKFLHLASLIIQSNIGNIKTQQANIIQMQEKELVKTEKEITNLLQMKISELISDVEFLEEKRIRENKKTVLLERIKNAPSSVSQVLHNIEKKFSSLVNLKERYIASNTEGRRSIFLSIGENYRLAGRKLNIIKPFWISAIEKRSKALKAELAVFELEKYIDSTTFLEHFRDMFPIMSALIDEVRTEMMKEVDGKLSENFVK